VAKFCHDPVLRSHHVESRVGDRHPLYREASRAASSAARCRQHPFDVNAGRLVRDADPNAPGPFRPGDGARDVAARCGDWPRHTHVPGPPRRSAFRDAGLLRRSGGSSHTRTRGNARGRLCTNRRSQQCRSAHRVSAPAHLRFVGLVRADLARPLVATRVDANRSPQDVLPSGRRASCSESNVHAATGGSSGTRRF